MALRPRLAAGLPLSWMDGSYASSSRTSATSISYCPPVADGQASFGKTASKSEWVYEFKVALVMDPEGVVSAFGLAPAASDERPISEALIASDHHEAYLWPRRAASQPWNGRGTGWRTAEPWCPQPRRTAPRGPGGRPTLLCGEGRRVHVRARVRLGAVFTRVRGREFSQGYERMDQTSW